MTTSPALDWLGARFEQITERHAGDFRYAPGHRKWRGPEHVRPMIELLSVMDAGASMRIIPGDYDDPQGVAMNIRSTSLPADITQAVTHPDRR